MHPQAPGTHNIMGHNILTCNTGLDHSYDNKLYGYLYLQNYAHSSINVHIQDKTTDDQDISFEHSTFHSVALPFSGTPVNNSLCPRGTRRVKWSRMFRNSLHAVIPPLWGILVYKNDTSIVTSKVPGGSSGNLVSLVIKSVVSRMCGGREIANSCKNQSANRGKFFVKPLFEDTISLPGLPGLCILGMR